MSTLKTNNIQHVDRSEPSILINTDGSVNIAGTMTYEDVTSVDAVGIITGRDNLDAQKQVLVGTGVSIKAGGLNVTAGISTFQDITAVNATISNDVSIADKIVHTGDGNTAIRFPAADTITAETAGSERLRIRSDGTVDIGGGSHSRNLTVHSATNSVILIEGNSDATSSLMLGDNDDEDVGMIQYNHASNFLAFTANTAERVRINSSGNLLIGHTSSRDLGGLSSQKVVIEGTSGNAAIGIINNQNSGGFASLRFSKSRGTSVGSNTIVQSGDPLGGIVFCGADGNDMTSVGAQILAEVDGTPGSNDMPARLEFFTTPDGSASPTERMRIDRDGRVMIGNDQASTQYQDGGDDLVIGNTSGSHGITIISQNNNVGRIMFSDTYTSGTGTYEGQILYSHALNTLNFYANYTATNSLPMSLGGSNGDLTLHTGNLVIGTSGKGIDFSATANASGMSNELLDDYEEGSWTPAYGSSSVPSSTYTNTAGYYTLIGNTVFYTGRIQMSDSTVNGNPITMGGFPFSAASAVGKQGGFDITFIDNWYSGSSGTNSQVTFLNSGGTAYGYFYNGDGNTIAANATYDSARRTLHFKGHYFI